MLKRSIIALSLLTILSGCSLDGDDGKDGLQGEQGPAGQNGTDGVNGTDGTNGNDGANGTDANAALTINLIGRAVLNAESPEGAAEIVAYQASKQRIFAINSSGDSAVVNIMKADSFDRAALVKDNEGVINGTNLTSEITLALNEHSVGDANSIAIDANNELLAVAMAASNTGDAGLIAFYDISGDEPQFIKNV